MSPGPIQLDQATALTLMLGPNGSVGIQARTTSAGSLKLSPSGRGSARVLFDDVCQLADEEFGALDIILR